MSEESTTPDLVELTLQAFGVVSQQARAAAERLAESRG
jgi:hypothetical protein